MLGDWKEKVWAKILESQFLRELSGSLAITELTIHLRKGGKGGGEWKGEEGGENALAKVVVHTPVKGIVPRDFRRQQLNLMFRAWGPDIPLDVYLFLIYIFI